MKQNLTILNFAFGMSIVVLTIMLLTNDAKADDEELFKSIRQPDFWEQSIEVKYSATTAYKGLNVGMWHKINTNQKELILGVITGAEYSRVYKNAKEASEKSPQDEEAKEFERLWFLFYSQKVIISHLVSHIDSIIYDKSIKNDYPIIDLVNYYTGQKLAEFISNYATWKVVNDTLINQNKGTRKK
jgi:hypothetical protein